MQTPEHTPRPMHREPNVKLQPEAQNNSAKTSRTRLSSGAKMFQPRPPATATMYYATPKQPYPGYSHMAGSLPGVGAPATPAWSQYPQTPYTGKSFNLLSTPSPTNPSKPEVILSSPTPEVILGSAALPSLGSGGHATGECKPCIWVSARDTLYF